MFPAVHLEHLQSMIVVVETLCMVADRPSELFVDRLRFYVSRVSL